MKEQTEEETLAMDLLGKVKIAGGANANNDALYLVDRDLGKMDDSATLAQEVSVENP